MSANRRTVEPPEELRTLLSDIKALPFEAESSQEMYECLEKEMAGASEGDIAAEFHRRVEDLLKETTKRGLVGREASHAYYDLFVMKELLNLIATVTAHGTGYLLQRQERITPEALLEFWETSPLGQLAASGLTLRHLASGPLTTLIRDRLMWRIRQCPQCQTLFWAGRVDKMTCSSRCGDTRRQLLVRHRKKQKGQEYREQSRKNVKAAEGRRRANKTQKKGRI